jgi:hypothetical protein
MSKKMYSIPEDSEPEFDFGFMATSAVKLLKEAIQHTRVEEFSERELEYQKIITDLLKTIDPLLNMLAKDSEKAEYIYWPNRKEKIEEFRKKLRKIATIVEVTV